jgi:hypothetical protein
MPLPPGITHILRVLPSYLAYVGITIGGLQLARRQWHLQYPLWVDIAAGLSSQFIVFILKLSFNELHLKRDAKARDAVLPPYVKMNPQELLRRMRGSAAKGYIGELFSLTSSLRTCNLATAGDFLAGLMSEYGNTMLISMLGERRVCAI